MRFLLLAACSLVALASTAAEPPPFHVISPRDYQVVQRQTRLKGTITLRVSMKDPGPLQVRLLGTPLEGKLPAEWQTVEVEGDLGVYQASLPAPAGGWYRLELRVASGDHTEIIEHVGVGEVFVVAGQSNSTNYGSEKQKTATGQVVSFDGQTWRLSEDPQPGTYDHSKNGSFIPAFGDALATRLGVPVAVACTGNGATSVRQWLMKGEPIEVHPTLDAFVKTVAPGKWECSGELYDHFMQRIEALGPHGCRAVLWHQGESDAGQARAGYPADRQITGQQYRELLEKIIRASRKQAGYDLPWIVAEATYHTEADPADEEFRAAQKSLWDDHVALEGPDTDALRKEYRNGVHFNAKGLRAHGQLWADKVAAYLDTVFANETKG